MKGIFPRQGASDSRIFTNAQTIILPLKPRDGIGISCRDREFRATMASGMVPWNALLESLHSALIDELTELAPHPRPELGLPLRRAGFSLPSDRISEVWVVPVSACLGRNPESSGFALLGLSPGAEARLSMNASSLLERVIARAEKNEFPRRSLSMVAQGGSIHTRAKMQNLRTVIWFPMALGGEPLALGLGV